MEEWGAANCRLMNYLLQTQDLQRADVEFYLAYTAKVYDMAELYEWNSVLEYDYQYRELQTEHGFPWGTFAPHLDQKLLPKRYGNLPNWPKNNTQQPGRQGENRDRAQQDCKLFKASKGTYCPFGDACKYRHSTRPFPAQAPQPSRGYRNVEPPHQS